MPLHIMIRYQLITRLQGVINRVTLGIWRWTHGV